MKGLSILGCTGSVGTNVLRIVDAFPGRFEVVGLAGGRNVATLAEPVARHRPRVISVLDEPARDALARLVDLSGLRVGTGPLGMVEVATHEDARTVVASAVGAVGLLPTYRALEAGRGSYHGRAGRSRRKGWRPRRARSPWGWPPGAG